MKARSVLGALTAAVLALPGSRDARAQGANVSVAGVAAYVGSALVVQGVTEQGEGQWYGGRVTVRLGRIVVEASGLKGTITPTGGSAGFQQDGGEIRGTLGVEVTSWLGIEGGYAVRAFDSPAGYQKWTVPDAGARISMQLGTPALRGYMRASYLLGSTVTGVGSPTFGLGVEAGLRLEPSGSGVTLGAFYRLERFDFPGGSTGRHEHFDCLGVMLGVKMGRN